MTIKRLLIVSAIGIVVGWGMVGLGLYGLYLFARGQGWVH